MKTRDINQVMRLVSADPKEAIQSTTLVWRNFIAEIHAEFCNDVSRKALARRGFCTLPDEVCHG
jgi:hypothetical protein